jgi:hypothetical protein
MKANSNRVTPFGNFWFRFAAAKIAACAKSETSGPQTTVGLLRPASSENPTTIDFI